MEKRLDRAKFCPFRLANLDSYIQFSTICLTDLLISFSYYNVIMIQFRPAFHPERILSKFVLNNSEQVKSPGIPQDMWFAACDVADAHKEHNFQPGETVEFTIVSNYQTGRFQAKSVTLCANQSSRSTSASEGLTFADISAAIPNLNREELIQLNVQIAGQIARS